MYKFCPVVTTKKSKTKKWQSILISNRNILDIFVAIKYWCFTCYFYFLFPCLLLYLPFGFLRVIVWCFICLITRTEGLFSTFIIWEASHITQVISEVRLYLWNSIKLTEDNLICLDFFFFTKTKLLLSKQIITHIWIYQYIELNIRHWNKYSAFLERKR